VLAGCSRGETVFVQNKGTYDPKLSSNRLVHSYFAARGPEMAKILSGCNRTGGMLGMMLVANSAAAIYKKFHKSLRALLGNNQSLNKVKAPGS
jgi:hypothetical protein